MMIPGQVAAWIHKCEQNIDRMLAEGIDPEVFRAQYAILATIVKVARGDAVFHGTLHAPPNAQNAPPTVTEE